MQAFKHDYFSYFPDRYLLSITMIFGAAIAGMTSEGGGAVAFPVMTLVLGIEPTVARDFSLMIQSCGLLNQEIFESNSYFPKFRNDCSYIHHLMDENQVRNTLFDILYNWRNWWNDFGLIVIIWFGEYFAMFLLGLEVIDDLLDAHEKKLGFVCIWFSFAFALFLLNRC